MNMLLDLLLLVIQTIKITCLLLSFETHISEHKKHHESRHYFWRCIQHIPNFTSQTRAHTLTKTKTKMYLLSIITCASSCNSLQKGFTSKLYLKKNEIYIYIYIYMYVCMYVCIHVYIYKFSL
jgi:hypothetical protein